jgi:hypothetical protein
MYSVMNPKMQEKHSPLPEFASANSKIQVIIKSKAKPYGHHRGFPVSIGTQGH